ncbi:hypothetical protein D3C87_2151890 [compost metagenome]
MHDQHVLAVGGAQGQAAAADFRGVAGHGQRQGGHGGQDAKGRQDVKHDRGWPAA